MRCFQLLILVTGNFQSSCKSILVKRGIFSSSMCSLPLQALRDEELEKVLAGAQELGLFWDSRIADSTLSRHAGRS